MLTHMGIHVCTYLQVFAEKQDKVSSAIELPRLYTVQCEDHQWPIVYRSSYNIGFLEIEKLQSFDTNVWENVYQRLISKLYFQLFN